MFSSGNGDGFYGKPQEAVDVVQREDYKQFVRLKTGNWGQSTQQVAGFDGVSSFTHHSAEDGGGARVASSNDRQAKPKGLAAKAVLSGKGNCLECTTSLDSERLCNLEEGSPESGTYTRHGYIFSSLAGCLMKTSENGALPVVSVMRETESQLLPDVGAVVTYIRATEKDKVEIYKSFRPGDIVLAKVISLGDAQSNYLLTTAENELGVVVAHSESGVQMVPISWCEMQCPKTHTKEFRKVARVQPEFLQT
ncbi:Exosome complex component CSL4 [Microtus ochrogaster]|uniref:Exosome complex component CSL4 n=1 Tax=Microtus ochrogaster TaxID=79684 RepID=A0A8J6KRN5_MICOH|nr:Exosome complex component CSL4 [Microtus ochrogaster]